MRPTVRREKGFLLFEILVGMGILGITITAMLWSLTEGMRSYEKLKTRLIAVKLLQERMESLDGRFSLKDLPNPVGIKMMGDHDMAYSLVPVNAAKGDKPQECGRLTGRSTAPYVDTALSGQEVAAIQLTFPAPLSDFGCVERVYLMKPQDPANQKTKLALYKIRVEVYWPIAHADVTPGNDDQLQFEFLEYDGNMKPGQRKEMISATTVLLRGVP